MAGLLSRRAQELGRCEVRADLQRPLVGRSALVVDDVLDTGLSLGEAAKLVKDAGASEVLTAVFARKPWDKPRIEPDFIAWEAPARYLVGYGLDDEGKSRGLPYVGAMDSRLLPSPLAGERKCRRRPTDEGSLVQKPRPVFRRGAAFRSSTSPDPTPWATLSRKGEGLS